MGIGGKPTTRRALLTLTTALCTGLAAPAFAGSPHPNLDANGVDLTDGSFNPQLPIYTIGSGHAALSLVATPISGDPVLHNWSSISLLQSSIGGVTTASINLGATYDTFTSADGFAVSRRGTGATLELDGTSAIYRTLDGVTIYFANPYPGGFGGGHSNFCNETTSSNCSLLPIAIEGKSGLTVGYDWQITRNCQHAQVPDVDPDCNEFWRLRGVSNDAGYSINWTYVNPTGLPYPDYFRPATATFANASAAGPSPTVTYGYPSSGVTTITTPGGKTWRITATSGAITGIRRPGASNDSITVASSNGQVSSVTSDGVTTNYNRSVSGSTATMVVTDALSNATTIVSDMSKFRPTAVTDALGRTTAMAYDSVGRLTEITYPEGNRKQFGYDAASRTTSLTLKAKPGSGLADIVTSTGFGAACADATCPAWSKDANGQQTDYEYDATTGLVTTITAPAPTIGSDRPQTRITYVDVAGTQLVRTIRTCRSGAATTCGFTVNETKRTFAYDANMNPVTQSIAAGDGSVSARIARTFDPVGNLLTVDGPIAGGEDTTTYRWSADRERLGAIDPDPDGAGTLARRATRTTYNGDGQPTLTETGTVTGTDDTAWAGFSPAQQVATGYDANARPVRTTLAAGGTTFAVAQTSYDAVGRVECSATRMNPGVFAALPASACAPGTTGVFGPDRIAKATYDAAGQQTKVTSAYGSADQSDDAAATYTANGQVATATDAEGNRTTYAYDGFDRTARVTFPSTTKGAGTRAASDYEQYAYDPAGAVTSRRLRDGATIGYAYDALGRLAAKDLPGSEPDVSYGYDLTGNLTSAATASGAGAQTLTFAWDALGRQVGETGPLGTLDYGYDLAGRPVALTWPDGNVTGYAWNAAGAPTGIYQGSGTGTPLLTYGYDSLGRRTGIARANGAGTSYGYDAAGRLAALGDTFAGAGNNVTFAYNPAGQLASRTASNDAFAWSGAVNADRAYASDGLNRYGTAGPVAFGYDAKGNLTSSGASTFSYSAENRLTGAPGVTLTYDPLGRLYQVASGSTTTRFQYAGDRIVAEHDGSNNRLRRHVPGPGTDEPVVTYAGAGLGTKSWLHADERGSVVALSDASGALAQVNAYDEYGIPAAGNAGRFGYTGQPWLPEVGLGYYKARMYSPTLGRFMQTDPIGYADGLNWYNYVKGDPVNKSDPTGLQDSDEVIVCGGVTIAGECHSRSYLARLLSDALAHLNGGGSGIILGGGSGFAAGGHQDTPGDNTHDTRKPDYNSCATAMTQPGTIVAAGASATVAQGFGLTGSAGTFRNLQTGTTGYYVSAGGVFGEDASASFGGGLFKNISTFTGWSINLTGSLTGRSGTLSVNGSGSGITVGTSIGVGAAVSMTRTVIFNCKVSK